MSKHSLLFLLVPCLVWVTGCGNSGLALVKYPISGGEKITATLGPRGLEMAKNDDVEILAAAFLPAPHKKQLVYCFSLKLLRENTIRSIKIEDVSEEDKPPRLMLEDKAPVFVANVWSNQEVFSDRFDASLYWVYYEVDTPRIYRFTLTTVEGKKLVLHQVYMVNLFLKPMIKKVLDLSERPT